VTGNQGDDLGLNANDLPDGTEGLTDALAQLASDASLPAGSDPTALGRVTELLNPAIDLLRQHGSIKRTEMEDISCQP
jgi:hypothetical protein